MQQLCHLPFSNYHWNRYPSLLPPLWVIKWVCWPLKYTHTKPGGRLKWPYAKSPGWQPTLCVTWCPICWFALVYKKYGHTWHWMSFLRPGVIKQHKPNHHCCLGRGSMEWEIFPAFPCPAMGIEFQTFWCWVQHPIHWATCSNMHNDQLYAITRLTANYIGGLMSDLVNYKFRKVWSHMTPNVLAENRCQ